MYQEYTEVLIIQLKVLQILENIQDKRYKESQQSSQINKETSGFTIKNKILGILQTNAKT